MAKLTCPICGEDTFIYFGNPRKDLLCKKHGQMANAGEIVQCEKCGKWNDTGKDCTCQKQTKINQPKQITCITCGEPSGEKHFCRSCYAKYKNKTLYIKVRECKEFEKLDAEYESDLICKDGHVVRSKSEREIDNYLFDENIKHAYESEIYDPKTDTTIKPDFYLPNYKETGNDVYIEHWGYTEENKKYAEQRAFKLEIYKRLQLTLICTYEDWDMKNIVSNLKRKLNPEKIKYNQINYENPKER